MALPIQRSMDLKSFGAKLKDARERAGLTQAELVVRLGRKTVASISEYEQGKRRMAAVDLPDVARVLGVPITYFFEDVLAETDLELAVLEWFRTLRDERAKRQTFGLMKHVAEYVTQQEHA